MEGCAPGCSKTFTVKWILRLRWSSYLDAIDGVLAGLDIARYFDVIVSGLDVVQVFSVLNFSQNRPTKSALSQSNA